MIPPARRTFVALDTPEPQAARSLAQRLAGHVGGIKLGLEFFCAAGPAGIRAVTEGLDMPLFLDLKLHDIPNTVAGAIRSVMPLAPAFITLHTLGGAAMMRAAADAAAEAAAQMGVPRPKLLGVTVLTSMSLLDLASVGVDRPVADQVALLADLAHVAGMDGVVCSPNECAVLRRRLGPDFTLMVPGIRPVWASANDQKRIMTPAAAVTAGATYLVIGRPITDAVDPVEAAQRIVTELAA
ncbi:orotidine-5'-phosphate decarboxylase [Nitrospirillum sp. BR 11752]|uniref:orotidine-5'-phosphate decarboxylase n=1 Tax=Nitrospirillum sp. BR 11752 TaxID=3104293 RepID=UPI002EB4C52B|nr:orotidine-5'-phosphate decarboxylase [Nitrospirillum sp. BR 11752]